MKEFIVVQLYTGFWLLVIWAITRKEKTPYEGWTEESRLKEIRKMLVNRKGGDD